MGLVVERYHTKARPRATYTSRRWTCDTPGCTTATEWEPGDWYGWPHCPGGWRLYDAPGGPGATIVRWRCSVCCDELRAAAAAVLGERA